MYEYSISGALTFALAYLIVGRKYDLRWLGLPISIAVLLILGTAITLLYRPSAPLVPALQSTWLVVHVFAAILSGGVFLLSNTIAATYLWLDRMERKGERTAFAKRLPAQFGLKLHGDVIGDGILKRPGRLLPGSCMPHIYMHV
jgi:ABC-type transport system involved in cytochrome c biogenesis permease subunit